jgi:hypothetical protein
MASNPLPPSGGMPPLGLPQPPQQNAGPFGPPPQPAGAPPMPGSEGGAPPLPPGAQAQAGMGPMQPTPGPLGPNPAGPQAGLKTNADGDALQLKQPPTPPSPSPQAFFGAKKKHS